MHRFVIALHCALIIGIGGCLAAARTGRPAVPQQSAERASADSETLTSVSRDKSEAPEPVKDPGSGGAETATEDKDGPDDCYYPEDPCWFEREQRRREAEERYFARVRKESAQRREQLGRLLQKAEYAVPLLSAKICSERADMENTKRNAGRWEPIDAFLEEYELRIAFWTGQLQKVFRAEPLPCDESMTRLIYCERHSIKRCGEPTDTIVDIWLASHLECSKKNPAYRMVCNPRGIASYGPTHEQIWRAEHLSTRLDDEPPAKSSPDPSADRPTNEPGPSRGPKRDGDPK